MPVGFSCGGPTPLPPCLPITPIQEMTLFQHKLPALTWRRRACLPLPASPTHLYLQVCIYLLQWTVDWNGVFLPPPATCLGGTKEEEEGPLCLTFCPLQCPHPHPSACAPTPTCAFFCLQCVQFITWSLVYMEEEREGGGLPVPSQTCLHTPFYMAGRRGPSP